MLSKPANPDHMECYRYLRRAGYGLYYGSCEDDYKLLVVTTESDNVYIYSLKSDSWRNLNKKAPFQEIYYWFDTTTERFHKIETPLAEYDNTIKPDTATTTVYRGSIHFFVKYDIGLFTCIELWKLNEDGDIWSKVVTYQLRVKYEIQNLSPLHLMSNGNWLMMNYRNGMNYRNNERVRICQVDLKKNKYTKDKDCHKSKAGKNKSNGNYHDKYKLYYSDFRVGCPEEFIYTETFVSPNQYMK